MQHAKSAFVQSVHRPKTLSKHLHRQKDKSYSAGYFIPT